MAGPSGPASTADSAPAIRPGSILHPHAGSQASVRRGAGCVPLPTSNSALRRGPPPYCLCHKEWPERRGSCSLVTAVCLRGDTLCVHGLHSGQIRGTARLGGCVSQAPVSGVWESQTGPSPPPGHPPAARPESLNFSELWLSLHQKGIVMTKQTQRTCGTRSQLLTPSSWHPGDFSPDSSGFCTLMR